METDYNGSMMATVDNISYGLRSFDIDLDSQ